MSILQEFKEFVSKGNVIDLAVGVVIGGAFGKIVTSIVDNIIMPPIGYILGGVNFKDLNLVLADATVKTNAKGVEEVVAEVAIKYGAAIQSIIDFLLIAFFIFMMIKALNKLQKTKEVKAEVAAPSKEESLLAEIRDLLKQQK